jgi:O-antigen/teichoic acid export membrane protein
MPNLLRSLTSIFSGRIVKTAIGVVFTPFLVRVLTQPQYGIYATVMASFAVLSLLSKGGIFDALRKMVAEHTPDDPLQSDIVSTALMSSLLYFFIIMLGSVFFVSQFQIISLQAAIYIPLLLFTLLFSNLFAVVRGAFYGLQREHVTEILQSGQKAIFAGLALTLAYLGFELTGVFAGYLISFAVVAIVGLWLLLIEFQIHVPPRHKMKTIASELFSYGGTQLIGGLSALLLYKSDILLVRYFRGSTAAALYNSAIVPAEYVWFVPAVIQMAFLQRSASLWADGKISEINNQIELGVKYGLLSLSLFGVGLFVLASPFLGVYFGAEYVPARRPLQVLIVGTIFFGVSRVVSPVFQATGWIKYTEAITVFVLVINITLNILLIPRFGILGAAIATSFSYICIFVGMTAIWWRSVFELPNMFDTGKIVVVQCIFALIFFLTVELISLSGILSLAVFPIAGGILFISLNVISGLIGLGDILRLYQKIVE